MKYLSTIIMASLFLCSCCGLGSGKVGVNHTNVVPSKDVDVNVLIDKTVRILSVKRTVSSGVILSNDGVGKGSYILAAGHPFFGVSSTSVNCIFLNDDFFMTNCIHAKVVWLSVKADAAILHASVDFGKRTLYNRKFNIGQDIIVVGFPRDVASEAAPGVASTISVIRSNIISGVVNIRGNMLFVRVGGFLDFGCSGGPIFNTNGKLIGIVSKFIDYIDKSRVINVPHFYFVTIDTILNELSDMKYKEVFREK